MSDLNARTTLMLLAAGLLSSSLVLEAGIGAAQAAPADSPGVIQIAERDPHPGPPPKDMHKAPPPPKKDMRRDGPPPPRKDMRRDGPPPPKKEGPPPPKKKGPPPPK